MTAPVKALVLTGYGTNCEVEMAHACKLGGFDQVDIAHISEVLAGEYKLKNYHMLNLPGGFLDGDDLGAGQAGAHRLRYAVSKDTGQRLLEQILDFIEEKKLILGVCNGFQLMAKMGLLPGLEGRHDKREVSLAHNDSSRFEDRWVNLVADTASPCIYTKGIKSLYFPVRHGEGKFVTENEKVLERINEQHLVALRYADSATGQPTMTYPLNPNGSPEAIAGICDPSGRLFGLMPHPEAFLHRTNHPRWTRENLPEEGQGVMLFRNAAQYCRSHLI